MIDPTLFTEETYRRVEGSMTNNAKRYLTYGWYVSALGGAPMPQWWDLREYGREYALALILEGHTLQDALAKATKAVYHYAYDDAKGVIKHSYKHDTKYISATSCTDTIQFTGVEPETVDSHNDFEFDDLVSRIWFLDERERNVITLLDAGISLAEIGRTYGYSRQWVSHWLTDIKRKMNQWLSEEDHESWQELTSLWTSMGSST